MRIPPKPQVCSGILCGLLISLAGCTNPSSQTLDSLTVTATPSTVSVGGAAVLKAMAHLSDGTTQDVTSGTQWTLSNPALATMTGGAVTATAPGTLTVQASYVETTPAGTSPAAATTTPQNLTASTQIAISAQPSTNTPVITWSAPAAITYGTALSSTQLNATANVPGTFAYTPAAGTVLKLGTQTLSAVFTPTDSKTYSAATATVQLSVSQAIPVITWAAPAAMALGTALSSAQLDATANVPGAFTYNPAAGTVPQAGTVQLTATFTPTDTTDYPTTIAHNTVVVGSTPGPTPTPGPIPSSCGGPTINLNSGMSTSTLQSTISSAPDCSLIVFAPGTYNITSQIKIPCPKTGMTITGPNVNWPGPYTATLNGSVSGNWGFSFGFCAAAVTIEYLNWNGGEPSAGGGGFLYVGAATSNLTVQYNYLHGNQANVSGSHNYDSLIWMDGNYTDPSSYYDTHDTIQWNIFGATNDGTAGNADCGAVSALYNYQGANFDAAGGYCAAVGIHESTTNLSISNNIIHYQEQGLKFFEAGAGSTYYQTNDQIDYNYFSFIHRIYIESQQTAQPTYFNDNVTTTPVNPSFGTWEFSIPQGASNNSQNNVMIMETTASAHAPSSYEFWGYGNADNNLIQGYQANSMMYGYGGSPWSTSNEIIQNLSSGVFINNEENISCCYPAQNNNSETRVLAAQTSTAPTISPAPTGGYSAPISVTLSDTGAQTSGQGPQGNTSIYYTTDGSTPTTNSTACNASTSGTNTCTISVAPGTTVKAIGMWGSINQPKSYPTGYGFVSSAVVTASYASGSAVKHAATTISSVPAGTQITTDTNATTDNAPATAAFQSIAIGPSAPVVAIGATVQLKAIATLSDGSTKDVTADVNWSSSDLKTIAVSSSGLLSGLASGQAILFGLYRGQQASVLATSSFGDIQWSGPIVITQGGNYSGNWQSTDAKTPAVTIATADPVIIQDSHISSSGTLIEINTKGADLSVRNSLALALNPSVKGQPNGVFLDANSPARLDVENNYMENVRYGVMVRGYSGNRTGQQTIIVRGNRARNLNGLLSDGMGGYLPGEGTYQSASGFLKLQDVRAVPGVDLGWNEVVNYPAHSLVSDVIDLYRASGTPNQPLEVHHTYIEGAYPYKPAQDAYQGGGIKTDGDADDTPQDASAFSYIHDNQVVGTVSYGIALTAGHDNVAANNRVISSGLLSDGTKIAAQRVGLINVNGHADTGDSSAYNNSMHDNLSGWTCWSASCAQHGYRQDQYFPASSGDYSSNSVVSAKQITLEMEQSEYSIWMNKVASAGMKVGPSF
jgi:Bacterial Ig-like domain (group 2)/Chitobiase/beta-hexosaminidase C-terminal domain